MKFRYALFAALLFYPACSPMDGYRGHGSGWHMMPGGMGGYGLFGLLFWIFLIAIAVYLVLYLLRGGSERSSEGRSASQSALDILEERYARGEIDKQEFEEKKRDLIR